MKKLLLIFLILLNSACIHSHHGGSSASIKPDAAPNQTMNELAIYAMSLSETPYKYGGDSSVNGFDCSGFVRYVFLKSLGMQLPRSSQEISRVGEPLKQDPLRPGDLVFFNTQQKPYSHVGIYVGENRFVHAPKSGKAITIVNMQDDYWRKRYDGARRITPP